MYLMMVGVIMTILNTNTAFDFYNRNYEPWLPSRHRWRQYRTLSFEGVWDKLTIPSLTHAKKYFSNIPPKTVFYSVIQHTDPRMMGSKVNKRGFQVGNHLIVGIDLPFDFDIRGDFLNYETLNEVRARTLKFYRFLLTRPELDILYICFTGGKGFHILCRQNNLKLAEDPKERLAQVTHDRKIYIYELLKEYNEWAGTNNKCPFDDAAVVTLNPHAFIRLPGTAHPSGFVCTLIDPEQLYCPLHKFYVHHVNGDRPAIPSDREMTTFLLPKRDMEVEDPGQPSPSLYFVTFMTSEVIGIPSRDILILKYRDQKLTQIEPILENLIKTYKLTDLYVFKGGNETYVVCLRTFQRKRLLKIYKKSYASNRHDFKKFGRTFMRVGFVRDGNKNVVGGAPKFIKMIETPYEEEISYGHYYFFRDHGVKMGEFIRGHGNHEVEITNSTMHIRGVGFWEE